MSRESLPVHPEAASRKGLNEAGHVGLHFHREAETLVDAIRSAIKDVRGTGFDVARVEIEPAAVVPST